MANDGFPKETLRDWIRNYEKLLEETRQERDRLYSLVEKLRSDIEELEYSRITTKQELNRERDRYDARTKELTALLDEALAYLQHGDFSNGVTDPTGSINQGDVLAGEFADRIRQAINKDQ